ncbi:MAG: transcription-repair coupling factor [Spirochaetes bacterium]|nr:MAG: transcription-repair coupling factor [Spirochaetota bacterium]
MLLKPLTDSFIRSAEFATLRDGLGRRLAVEGIAPSSFPFIAASVFNDDPRQTLVIVKNRQAMLDAVTDLCCWTDHSRVFALPAWETLPYEFVSPPENIERERITSLYRLIGGEPGIFVAPVESLVRLLPSRAFLLQKGISLEAGEDYPFDDIVHTLAAYGFTREYRVETYGQFSVKGGIIDVYLPTADNPVRLDFFGDTLETIREFDPESQISLSKLDGVTVYPRKELILSKREHKAVADELERAHSRKLQVPELAGGEKGDILHHGSIPGIEDLFPLIVDPATLLSLAREDARIIVFDPIDCAAARDAIVKTFSELYRRRHAHAYCLPPEKLIAPEAMEQARDRALDLQVFTTTPGAVQMKLRSIPNYHGKIKMVREELADRLAEDWRVYVCTGFEGQARRLYDLLSELSPSSSFEAIEPGSSLSILISPLKEGFELVEQKALVLTDHEIFGKAYRKKKHFKRKGSRPIESFLDLEIGDRVVHINHGIGFFRGIERMTASGVERDFLIIEYAGGDKLYVSLDQITMVQKFVGMDGREVRIDALGKKSAWNRIKERVQKSVEEIANELMHIYSRRRALKGYQFPPDTVWQEEFESQFEYDETPDQITAIEDIKDDMEKAEPMDRLVCGDVGFGKTEVAIRAAFKAVMAGKQVAVLVPTTVLAMQHYSTFSRRFADYPITIETVSRFRSRGEIAEAKRRLTAGSLDIIIGTHALLAKDVLIKNLGLIVIDEEQRFGVMHKEKLKKLRTQVDVVTLSATPIPRTLHMSLAGIRDLSIISTPPENRQSIETYVIEENPDIVRMAILKEIERGGQVFYVHNRVQTIDAQAAALRELVPEASSVIAHGQMPEHELEDVIIDFLARKYDILISTSIIESGLDMPNVNTIIINRADTFGLSQLYQLKGRVGRSITQAYAYLTYPRHIALSETAQKRLSVIAEYSDLGSGFKIAMKDMEIRGSGNILGREQSGNIMDVGFDLYCQMLEDAVRRLKGERPLRMFRTPVFMKTNFFIPETYIADERQKIEFYKRFESCELIEEVDELEKEMTDRFGHPPGEVRILVELEKIRTIASTLMVGEILEDSRGVRIRISGDSRIDVKRLLALIKKDKRFSLDPVDKEVLHFRPGALTEEKKLDELKKCLQQMI